jgi:ribosomal protein L11 methyltransferase
MESRWTEITLTVPSPLAEDTAAFLVELTGCGVSIDNRAVDTFSLDSIEEGPSQTLRCYLPADTSPTETLAAIRAHLSLLPEKVGEPTVSALEGEDWATSWKVHFKPVRIGRRLVIKPSWEEFTPRPGDLVIEIDPGMAFGTGTHHTTRLCLETLEDLADGVAEFSGTTPPLSSLLDVGTGSGVLAMAAALLLPARVHGIDIDAGAVTVAAGNIDANGLDGRITVDDTPLQQLAGPYDVVLANIIAEELVNLSDGLCRVTAPGGILVLSGILAERLSLVTERFTALGCTILAVRDSDEWRAVSLRNP